jgi:alpha-N-arabinofuranosidase
MKPTLAQIAVLALFTTAYATEFHVATNGNDRNSGTKAAPLRTIQRAAELAQPGDVITVRAGVYRERINPPRGGKSPGKRIVYQVTPGEKVEIKGSEVIKGWAKLEDDTWKVILTNSFFGKFNPYSDLIHGDWFEPKGRQHHTGAVYLNGDWLPEAAKLEDVLKPAGSNALWYAQVDQNTTTIWAQFEGVNPNEQLVEINVRQTVFYPDQPFRDYITVRGFILSQAATPWAPPTAEQIGLIGTHWSKGWIIENNLVSHSVCSGIALGKYGDRWDNTSGNSAEGYVETIQRALKNGWNKEAIGHHLVRSNEISYCEQAGIVGSLGAAFSTVIGNNIHDIHVRELFSGAEMAGIKFHAAIDTVIRSNHVYRTCRGLWLDWMAQGTRVSGNLFHENAAEDLFVEVDHGPFLVDNNLFLSGTSLLDMSEGGAYAHNLFAGRIVTKPELSRSTPYHPAHSTEIARLVNIQGGDDRFYNNIFIGNGSEGKPESGFGLWVYDQREAPLQTGGNVYYNGARPYIRERHFLVQPDCNPGARITQEAAGTLLHLSLGAGRENTGSTLVTTGLLGKAHAPGLAYENPDGSPVRLTKDYFGKTRRKSNSSAGPFELQSRGTVTLRVW